MHDIMRSLSNPKEGYMREPAPKSPAEPPYKRPARLPTGRTVQKAREMAITMAKDKHYSLFRSAIERYMDDNNLRTDYEKSFGWNNEEGRLAVFDVPSGYDHDCGLMNDDYSCTKPVLVARIDHDGYAYVEETEYTDKYMRRSVIG